MTTFVLVHGAGGTSGYWQLVTPLLRAAGHHVAAPDLPNHPGATFADQAEAVVAAADGADDVVLVAQSMGAYPAGLACARLPVRRLVLLNAMVPRPGESAGDWWAAVGQESARAENDRRQGRDPGTGIVDEVHLLHDVEPAVLALLGGESAPAGSLFEAPFPLDGWPDVPTVVLVGREDRLFPPALQRRVARERLGLEAVELPGGHLAALSQPRSVADALLAAATTEPTPG
jgi:pimeloyl-ACP methyl ester carboxylesterase